MSTPEPKSVHTLILVQCILVVILGGTVLRNFNLARELKVQRVQLESILDNAPEVPVVITYDK